MIFTAIVNDASPNITYSAVTGEFTITATGNYYVHWWVATDGAEAATSISFGIDVDAVSTAVSSSPIVTGQISGDAFLTIGTVPATVQLINRTGSTVTLADIPVRASLVIVEQTA